MTIFRFSFPTTIHFGPGARKLVGSHLAERGLKRPLVVTDKGLAALPITAELMVDWVYDVTRAARLANFIYYISPVKGVDEAIKELDPEAATNPLLFPPADVVAKQHPQPTWSEEDEIAINELFGELSGV